MRFYTNFYLHGSTLKIREINKGVRSSYTKKVTPTLYVTKTSDRQELSTFTNIYDEPLVAKNFDSVKDARNFIKEYGSVGQTIYGFDRFAYDAINDVYPGEIEYDFSLVNIVYIDIETCCENSFPDIETADQPVNAITVGFKGKLYSFGYDEYTGKGTYKRFANEYDMLVAFVTFMAKLQPDIISGWNVNGFDMPYLYQRILDVLGEKELSKLSPWGDVTRRQKFDKKMSRTTWAVNIAGVSILDYLELYKKFRLKMRESYKLDYIAYVELGKNKLDYSEYDTLHELYKYNYTKFLDYNRIDVELVMQLEQKLAYISLAMIIAYYAKTNYEDVYSNVRLWDVIISNYLKTNNKVVHCTSNDSDDADEQYEGAFVKNVQAGFYKMLVSFDLTSLYPSLMRSYNISPEAEKDFTIMDVLGIPEMNADIVVNDAETMSKITDYLKQENLTMASNGTLYSREKMSFLADLMGLYFSRRKAAKKEMLKYDSLIEQINVELSKRGYHE